MSAAQVLCCVYVWVLVVAVNGLSAQSAVESSDLMLLTANTRSESAQIPVDFEGFRLSVRICSRARTTLHDIILQSITACTAPFSMHTSLLIV